MSRPKKPSPVFKFFGSISLLVVHWSHRGAVMHYSEYVEPHLSFPSIPRRGALNHDTTAHCRLYSDSAFITVLSCTGVPTGMIFHHCSTN
jgi:hypothetical protein